MKKILVFLLCAVLALSFIGCGGGKKDDASSTPSEPPAPEIFLNPLTGTEIEKEVTDNKVTAVVIENSTTVQGVQTGIGKFDIVYEYPVEGGITRMLAVTKNIGAIGDIGNIRSAREVALELARGHDANFVHAGLDNFHFLTLRDYKLKIKTYDLLNHSMKTATNNPEEYCSERRKNGLSSEHTLYTNGKWLLTLLEKKGINKGGNSEPWISFSEEAITSETACNKINVPFSGSHVVNFTYNETTGKYTKQLKNGSNWKDYFTGENAEFANVFVLFTTVKPHNCTGGDNKNHVRVDLEGGNGYYVSKGGVENITWTKGGVDNSLSFKKADGSEFSANAGNSYVCVIKDSATVTIE